MAIYYIDLASGNDSTGTGSNILPWKTVNKAIGTAGGPHDIRVAKTAAASLVDAGVTFSWTYNSKSVTLSVAGTIVPGDFIGKPTAAGNGAFETFYRVATVAGTTITLANFYAGSTGTTAGVLQRPAATIISGGTNIASFTSSHTLSGGWNLGTQLQDGETWCKTAATGGTAFLITPASTGVSISNMNFAETAIIFTNIFARNVSISYCSCLRRAAGSNYFLGVTTNGSLNAHHNIFMDEGSTYTVVLLNNPYPGESFTFQNNNLVCGAASGGTAGIYISTVNGTESEVELGGNTYYFYKNNGIYIHGGKKDINFNGDYVKDCNRGVYFQYDCTTISNLSCVDCTIGIIVAGGTEQHHINNVTFNGCTTGISVVQCHTIWINDCIFLSCTNGIIFDVYSGGVDGNGVRLSNCAATTPVTSFLKRGLTNGTIEIKDCTIDAPSEAKAINIVTTSEMSHPQYIIKNSFNTYADGMYFSNYSLTKDVSVYRTSAPSWKLLSTSTISGEYLTEASLRRVYNVAGNSKTITLWIKCDNTWAGTIIPKWKLDNIIIKTEATISSLTTSWAEYSYTVDGSLATWDGVLSFEVNYNANAIAVYFDDMVIT
ncbi:MAG: hypothetical protein WC119_05810 [Synergistaceae bacterium]